MTQKPVKTQLIQQIGNMKYRYISIHYVENA